MHQSIPRVPLEKMPSPTDDARCCLPQEEETSTRPSMANTEPVATLATVATLEDSSVTSFSIPRIRKGTSSGSYLCRRAAWGVLSGGLIAITLLVLLSIFAPSTLHSLANLLATSSATPVTTYDAAAASGGAGRLRGEKEPTGVKSYLNLFARPLALSDRTIQSTQATIPPRKITLTKLQRRLADSSSGSGESSTGTGSSSGSGPSNSGGSFKDAQLVIAGKMAVEDAPCNIAQFNLKTQEWSLSERIQLSLYNSYSGGEVYSLLANHTNNQLETDSSKDSFLDAKR